jgi:hypothetical protein
MGLPVLEELVIISAPAPEPLPILLPDATNADTTTAVIDQPDTTAAHRLSYLKEPLQVFAGDGTAFSDSVNNTGAGFACSYRYLNDRQSRFFAAINQAQWEEGRTCGRCARARCVDERCPVRNEDVVVSIVDL